MRSIPVGFGQVGFTLIARYRGVQSDLQTICLPAGFKCDSCALSSVGMSPSAWTKKSLRPRSDWAVLAIKTEIQLESAECVLEPFVVYPDQHIYYFCDPMQAPDIALVQPHLAVSKDSPSTSNVRQEERQNPGPYSCNWNFRQNTASGSWLLPLGRSFNALRE